MANERKLQLEDYGLDYDALMERNETFEFESFLGKDVKKANVVLLEDAENAFNSCRVDLIDALEEIEALKTDMATLVRNQEILSSDLEKAKIRLGDLDSLESRCSLQEANMNDLNIVLNDRDNIIASQKLEIDKLARENSHHQSEANQLLTQKQDLEELVSLANNEIDSQVATYNELLDAYNHLVASHEQLEQSNIAMSEDVTSALDWLEDKLKSHYDELVGMGVDPDSLFE